MGSKEQIGILKRDGIGKQHFDMENILTRSLYRVLNNTTQVPPHIAKNQNVDKMMPSERRTTIAVARPNNHQIGNASAIDMDTQMRLLAQEICGRVERKYERKLEEARDRDRRETDRRLDSIRSEYEAKYQLQLSKLEKEKTRLLDQLAERERTLEHRMEMRSAEKEHDLSAKQRIVENRAIELQLNKENFEQMREEWQRKMDGEAEEMRLERERIEVLTSKTSERKRADLSVEAEAKMWKKRTEELEQDADLTRRKIGEMMEENFRLRDQAGSVSHVKRELDVTMSSLNETREELAASRVEIRRTGDFDRLKEENDQLRIEIERLRLQNAQRIQSAVDETVAEYSAKEAKWKRIAGLSQQRIAVLTEKLKELEMDRTVLRGEVKTMQKMVSTSHKSSHQKTTHATQKSKMIRSISPSGSTSSSLSDGELEILNIRQRIQNLDEIAKELDASVEHFSVAGARKVYDRNESNVEMYDDFCRALHSAVLDDDGSMIQKTSSPQKPVKRRESEVSRISGEVEKREKETEDWLKRSMRVVSPPVQRRIEVEEVRPKTPESLPRPAPTRQQIVEKPTAQPIREPTPSPSPPPPAPPPKEPEMSDFERRLQARSRTADDSERRNRLMQLASEPEPTPKPEPVQKIEESPAKPTSVDNPMFSGVDPVMAEYMKKVLAARNQPDVTSEQSAPIVPAPTRVASPPRPREVEVTLADELDLELDQPNAGLDDEWW